MSTRRADEGGSQAEGKGPPPASSDDAEAADEGPHGDTHIARDLEELARAEGRHPPPPDDDELRPDTDEEDEG
jgi:hypothetical protein